MDNKFYIYGVPGVGKTYLSHRLAEATNYPLVELDSLRTEAQSRETREQNPFVYLGTSEAYSEHGDFTKENIVKGLKSVRRAMSQYVSDKIDSLGDSYLVEGAFIDPNSFNTIAKGILVVQRDETKHFNQFFQNREKTQHNITSLQIAQEIQAFLIEEARSLNVIVMESGDDLASIGGE